jgi:S1-C subfamily serine protease
MPSSASSFATRLVAIPAAAGLFLWGCVSAPEPTPQQRAASFRLHQREFRADTVPTVLQTCLVIAAARDAPDPTLDPQTGHLAISPAPDGSYTQGLCVSVDPDGYLLTAAHVLRDRNFVIGWFGGGLRILPARLVFRNGPGFPRSDLAVIRVDGRPDYCARLGKVPSVGDPVFAVVCNRPPNGIGGALDLAAGIVLDEGADPSGGPGPVLGTDVPLWHGDSGGPLFSAGGELVGINSAITFRWFGKREVLGGYSRISYFPEEGLVRRAIAADKAAGHPPGDAPH